LELIDEALEAFMRATIPLSATDVDVSFEAPDRDWSAKLTRPTVNAFLWDIRRSASNARSGLRTVTRDGKLVHQLAFPMVEMRYVVSAWTTDHGDERGLLAGVVRTLLAHDSVPREYLPDALEDVEPPSIELARAGEDHMDVFKALEGQLKPGLNLVLTTEFDTGLFTPAGPTVGAIETSIGRMGIGRMGGPRENRRRVAGEVVNAENRGAIGAVVRAPDDLTVVNPSGQFLIRATHGDQIVLELEPEVVVTVGPSGGIRFE
jgi:hypothetical protein